MTEVAEAFATEGHGKTRKRRRRNSHGNKTLLSEPDA